MKTEGGEEKTVGARLAVTLTADELKTIVGDAVRQALDERSRTQDLAAEEMTLDNLVTLFHLSKKNGPITIWQWRRTRGFPAPHKRGGRRVLWLRSEVDAWRAAQGTSGPGAVTQSERRRKTTEDRGAPAPH